MMSTIQQNNYEMLWDALEGLDLDALKAATDPFKEITDVLDVLFEHEREVEMPTKCEEFFNKFGRTKGETLQAYLVRHASEVKNMREVGVDLPDLLAGWHMLIRATTPNWMLPQAKALCQGRLETARVRSALLKMFGGDSKPSPKDLHRPARGRHEEEHMAEA